MKRLLTPIVIGIFTIWASAASATIMLSPGGEIANGPETSQAQIDAAIASFLGTSTEVYKQNVGDAFDTGSAAAWYETTFMNSAADPSDADITHVSGQPALTDATHLLVKDGNQDPGWYLFDISGWDGLMTIELRDFWPNQGAISHVAIYAGGGGGIPIPEAGTLGLLGLGLIGLGLSVRHRQKVL